MAIDENFDIISTSGQWVDVPEYHNLVLAFLASYKPYVSADELLSHLTTSTHS